VPVPPDRPCACDGAVLPVPRLSHFFGSRSGGVETPFERSDFFKNISNETRSIQFLMQELLALCSSGAMNATGPEGDSCVSDQ
jgi:hypothetical protein